ncbi:ImmA/IrrE family metallo-endopeptidase [Bradyrhizobium sp. BWA-3-5]|uniref:ImmA/IrrE family metallo-endopeptidase n=1 Tax=Bradyrhizobium sp. BWA-3-5 TaxID=3080013 RepID=UPI00293F4201|nr:protease inhibitor I42 family protein [Bradyrhizobium sp. BWA-3-5]WOH63694.1 protease inhibitor I42 family protein [Bradyrhizobium sp. BWA-3-5]
MVDNRAAILTGAKAAHTLHRDLGIREQIERGTTSRIDVFSTIAKLGATLMFQPLDKLLGAYLPAEELGVLITTKRPLPVQRFTGAHELGHLYMRHEPSLDDDSILRRSPFATTGTANRQEREADAFASMFLTPAWLVALVLQRQRWSARQLADPAFLYQASLRLGTSYRATCFAIERHKVITRGQREQLIDIEPKSIKQQLLGSYEPPDWRADVWLLTEHDEGSFIEGGRNDLFVVKLRENSGAGYLWNFDQLRDAGFALVDDDREDTSPNAIGGALTRKVTARSKDRVQGEVTLRESRPWATDVALHQLRLRYDLRGPESPGMWEPELRRVLQAA